MEKKKMIVAVQGTNDFDDYTVFMLYLFIFPLKEPQVFFKNAYE